LQHCPYCTISSPTTAAEPVEWGAEAMDAVLQDVKDWTIYDRWPDPVAAMTGCLRGMFTAAPGHDLISSDYSAIEAVVLACMAGEQWRIDVFKTHGKIYEMSASKISGIPFEEMLEHKRTTGQHHPLRKTIGKVAELASGYAGWIGAWKAFGADAFMSEPEIKAAILKWRAESPTIVQFWGGQWWQPDPSRWQFEPCLYGLEGAAVSAVMSPGQWYAAGPTLWGVHDDALYCQLPSGRFLTYHRPRLDQTTDQRGLLVWQLSYEGYNSDSSKGPVGWMRRSTYGGKLCENVVQAAARDVLADALLRLDAAGYHIVMHVHDEVVAEVPQGWGSVEELERIMSTMPGWCKDWPIRAAGGWRGLRYRKE
jgi:DNA polymerase